MEKRTAVNRAAIANNNAILVRPIDRAVETRRLSSFPAAGIDADHAGESANKSVCSSSTFFFVFSFMIIIYLILFFTDYISRRARARGDGAERLILRPVERK